MTEEELDNEIFLEDDEIKQDQSTGDSEQIADDGSSTS